MKQATRESYQERIGRVLLHLEEHLDEPVGLEELASVACLSPFHFHRVFRGMVGESVAQHRRRLRLERAAQQLRYSRRQVTDIALEAGYEALESFIRAFRTRFGVSPSTYRDLSRPDILAPNITGTRTLEPQGGSDMDVTIVTEQPRRVAYVRHVGPYDQCGTAWAKLCSWAGPLGLLGPGTRFIGLSHDDPDVTPADKVRYDACITVPDRVAGQGEIGVQEIPGGDFAVTIHQGPFEKMYETYAELCGGWLPGSGREMASRPSIEIYLNDPGQVPPEKIEVEIQLPLEGR